MQNVAIQVWFEQRYYISTHACCQTIARSVNWPEVRTRTIEACKMFILFANTYANSKALISQLNLPNCNCRELCLVFSPVVAYISTTFIVPRFLTLYINSCTTFIFCTAEVAKHYDTCKSAELS